jgi:hypothetical protein
MKRQKTRTSLIARLAAMVLSALCFVPAQIHAQEIPGYNLTFPSVGLVPGQSIRLTLFNPTEAPVRARGQAHSVGVNVMLGDGSVRSHNFHSFDFTYNDFPAASTGRIQINASIHLDEVSPGTSLDDFAATLEVIEESTGSTVVTGKDLLLGGSDSDVLSRFDNDILLGIVPGESLRVTLSNPGPSGTDYVPSRVKLFDAKGNLIVQSSDLVIPPGAFRSFQVNRSNLLLAGDRRTGRLQLRVHIETADGPGVPLAVLEIIDNNGRTTAHQNNLKQIGLAHHYVE